MFPSAQFRGTPDKFNARQCQVDKNLPGISSCNATGRAGALGRDASVVGALNPQGLCTVSSGRQGEQQHHSTSQISLGYAFTRQDEFYLRNKTFTVLSRPWRGQEATAQGRPTSARPSPEWEQPNLSVGSQQAGLVGHLCPLLLKDRRVCTAEGLHPRASPWGHSAGTPHTTDKPPLLSVPKARTRPDSHIHLCSYIQLGLRGHSALTAPTRPSCAATLGHPISRMESTSGHSCTHPPHPTPQQPSPTCWKSSFAHCCCSRRPRRSNQKRWLGSQGQGCSAAPAAQTPGFSRSSTRPMLSWEPPGLGRL